MMAIGMLSCSEDGTVSDTTPFTFLERFHFTAWLNSEGDYLRFYNRSNIPIEEWKLVDEFSCYVNFRSSSASDLEILENSYSKLVVKLKYPLKLQDPTVNYVVYTFTNEIDRVIDLHLATYKNDGTVSDNYWVYQLNSNEEIKGLVLCK